MIFEGIDPNYNVQKLKEITSHVSSLDSKIPSPQSLSDSLSNMTTTIFGSALLGFDGTNWRRVRVTTDGKLQLWLG